MGQAYKIHMSLGYYFGQVEKYTQPIFNILRTIYLHIGPLLHAMQVRSDPQASNFHVYVSQDFFVILFIIYLEHAYLRQAFCFAKYMYVYHSFNEKMCIYYINLEVTHACYTLLLTLSALPGHFASSTFTCEISTCNNNNNNNHHHHHHHYMNIQACFRHISNMGSFQKIIPQTAHFPSN